MLPRIVLHKRNGHSHAAPKSDQTPGRLMLMVHSGPKAEKSPGYDLLRFAALVRSEKPHAFVEQAARQIDGLKFSIADALAHTQAAFERGELADVRATMDSIRSQSQAAASFLRTLMRLLPPRNDEDIVLDLEALFERTLDAVRPHLGGGPALVARVEAGLPRLVGSPRHLQQALASFMAFVNEAIGSTETPERLVLEAVSAKAPDRAHGLIEVRIAAEGPGALAGTEGAGEPIDVRHDAGLAFACHVVDAHRGMVSARRLGPGRVAVLLELPAR